ncbi:MAG: hypothetical protein ATN35_10225 [Epulopiscium sp. Nele67-Bin004]|nr:MAG: hypothetical protein ATN35_10225 [Epulopiscium sp. Nele67-Bin004]
MDNREEIIDGNVVMQASPRWEHSDIVRNLCFVIQRHLSPDCIVYSDNVDLVIDDKTRYIPDLLVTKKENRLPNGKVGGVPKLIVEVWSPDNTTKERLLKKDKYARLGVNQFVEIDYKAKFAINNLLTNGAYYTDKHVVAREDAEFVDDDGNPVEVDRKIHINCINLDVDILDLFKDDVLKYL